MARRHVVDPLADMGLPPLPPGIRPEDMAEAIEMLLDGAYNGIGAPAGKAVDARSVQLLKRSLCHRQACSRCDRQLLSPSLIARLGNDHEFLDQKAFQDHISDTSKDLLSNFAFINAVTAKAALRGSALPRKEFCRLLDEIFPHMLPVGYVLAFEQEPGSMKNVRDCHEHGLKYFHWRRDDYDGDSPGSVFFHNIFDLWARLLPTYHLVLDNTALETGWSLLAFKLLSEDHFVEFSTTSTAPYCRAVDVVPGELHSDLIYSATRGALLLDSQAIIYKGLHQLASWILAHDVPAQSDIGWSVLPFSSRTLSMTLGMRLRDEVVPNLDKLLVASKKAFSAYRTHTLDNVGYIENFSSWLGKTSCPRPKALLLACSRHTLLRLRHAALLKLLRQDFTDLQSAVRGFVQGHSSKAKLIAAWENAEDALAICCRTLCKNALELSPYFNHYEQIMCAHYSDWLWICACEDRHVSFSDKVASGSTMLRLLCKGWTMPQKVRTVLGLLLSDRDQSACFQDEFHPELISFFQFAIGAYSALQAFNPCSDAPTEYDSTVRKLHGFFNGKFDTRVASVLAKLLPVMEAEPNKWTDMLWQKAFETIEQTWARQAMEVKLRRDFREFLGMPDRQDEVRRASNGILTEESSASGFERNARADLGQLVEPYMASNGGPRPDSHSCKGKGTLSSLWATDATLRDFGVSEGIKYGTPQKVRSSQFDEQISSSKTVKRRKASQAEDHHDPPGSDGCAGIDGDSPQKLGFRDPILYNIWRQIFPISGCNVRKRIKWDDLRRVMNAEPLYFEEVRNMGVESRWRREARDGYPVIELGFHQPHGVNPWIEKNLLKGIRKNVHRFTGWDAETFVLTDHE